MAFEREVIMNIRYRVDAYDEQCLFDDDANLSLNANTPVTHSHVRLGSLDNTIHLSSYAKKLSIDIRLQGLQALLVTFLHLNHVIDIEENVISGFKVCDLHLYRQNTHAHAGGPLSCATGHI